MQAAAHLAGWGLALWLTAGIEAAWGGGMPGPLLMVAVAAGLWSGPSAGAVAGAVAGICDAALGHGNLALHGLLGLSCGWGASYLTSRLSPRNLLVGVMAALLVSVPLCVLLTGFNAVHTGTLVVQTLTRSLQNALWMTAFYGIILVLNYSGVVVCSRR